MEKKIEVCHSKIGWYLRWPDGFVAAMPDEATARLLAAAPAMFKACTTAANALRGLKDLCTGNEWREAWRDLPDALDELQRVIDSVPWLPSGPPVPD